VQKKRSDLKCTFTPTGPQGPGELNVHLMLRGDQGSYIKLNLCEIGLGGTRGDLEERIVARSWLEMVVSSWFDMVVRSRFEIVRSRPSR
jgi:hypothetical protein